MQPRLLAVIAVLALAACSSSSTSSSPDRSSTASVPTRTSPVSAVADPSGLLPLLRRGLSVHTSAHVETSAQAGGTTNRVVADESLRDGVVTALHLTGQGAGVDVQDVVVGDTAWAREPDDTVCLKDARWHRFPVTGTTSPECLSVYQDIVGTFRALWSPAGVLTLVSAATSISKSGPAQLGAARGTRYDAHVIVSLLPDAFVPKGTDLAGITSVDVGLVVDAQGAVEEELLTYTTISGAMAARTTTFVPFDRAVSITAPPVGHTAA